ncbi:pesticin receptor precursor [Komagataeibacter europaeus]|uniref:Pesticin receptor n=1 Tax=Komagataeibacter europaeus TaxID=33995 RepID=A0A0M0EFQ8_KOMEU|nr:pesticin receptor precursor [Komagataeibacter europaeus]
MSLKKFALRKTLLLATAFGWTGYDLQHSVMAADTQPAHTTAQRPHRGTPQHAASAHTTAAATTLQSRAAPETISVRRNRAFQFSAAQHEPDSTSHISAAALIEQHVQTVNDLQRLVPNLTIQTEGGSTSASYYLRGIGLEDYTQNNMSSVMTYFDDVAYPISSMSTGQMFDVSAVAVEPGPVGTEHGMADTGGEVRIDSNAPTKEFHYGASEDIASYARSKTNAYVSGSITHNLQYRIAGQMLEGGGYFRNRDTGQTVGNANMGALRGRLAWQPDSKTNIDLIANWSQDESQSGYGFVLSDPYSSSTYGTQPRDQNIYNTGWNLNPNFAHLVGISPNSVPNNHNVTWSIILKGSRDLGFAKLKSITSFAQQQRHEYNDRDALDLRSGDTYFVGESNVFSQELRLEGRPMFNDRFKWTVGAYYNRTRTFGANWFDMTGTNPSDPFIRDSYHNQPAETFDQFVNLSYKIIPSVRVNFGLNHETDTRQIVDDTIVQYYGATNTNKMLMNGSPFPTFGAITNQFSGRVGIDWRINHDVMVYASIKRGVKPGGFTTNTTVSEVQLKPFKPEWVLAYEIGVKSEFFKHRLRINAAMFYDDYHDKQILGQIVIPGQLNMGLNPTPGIYGSYINAPKSTIWGTEVQIQAHPIRGLSLTQNIGWERGTYDDFQEVNQQAVQAYFAQTQTYKSFTTNYNGADMGIPKLTLNGSVSYQTRPLLHNAYTLTFEGNYSYRGAQGWQPRATGVYVIPAYFLMGASITFKPRNGQWYVNAYASNLLNRHYILSETFATVDQIGYAGAPRFVGGRFGCDF